MSISPVVCWIRSHSLQICSTRGKRSPWDVHCKRKQRSVRSIEIYLRCSSYTRRLMLYLCGKDRGAWVIGDSWKKSMSLNLRVCHIIWVFWFFESQLKKWYGLLQWLRGPCVIWASQQRSACCYPFFCLKTFQWKQQIYHRYYYLTADSLPAKEMRFSEKSPEQVFMQSVSHSSSLSGCFRFGRMTPSQNTGFNCFKCY